MGGLREGEGERAAAGEGSGLWMAAAAAAVSGRGTWRREGRGRAESHEGETRAAGGIVTLPRGIVGSSISFITITPTNIFTAKHVTTPSQKGPTATR